MKYPIIAINDESFNVSEPSVLYRKKMTIRIKNLRKHFLKYDYCDSNGDLYNVFNFQETEEIPKVGCNPFYLFSNFSVFELEFIKSGKSISSNDLRRIIRKNASKLHFVKLEVDRIELNRELDSAKTYRQLIECVFAAEWTEEEDRLNIEESSNNTTQPHSL